MLLYKAAESILQKVSCYKGSIKNLVFASHYKNFKQLYALSCETLKYSDILDEVIQQTQIHNDMKGASKHLIKLLLYDFLFGKGIQCSGKLKKTILSRKSRLQSTLARIKLKRRAVKDKDLIECNFDPFMYKYLRVNTLKSTLSAVSQKFICDGYERVTDANTLTIKQFMIDSFVENLLIFNIHSDFHKHPLYTNGSIIFQDRASCFPAQVLNPPSGSDVIDACAAPGNKTSHLAALMKNKGRIFSFDLSSERLKTMSRLLSRANVTNCISQQGSFLNILPTDPKYKNVGYILVDPSCSGSGIASRLSHLTDQSDSYSEDRLHSLAQFQLSILNHALSFPAVNRVVYSTCSIYEAENENVIKKALEQNPQFSLQTCLPTWKRRGNPVAGLSSIDTEKCVRCDAKFDCNNGFFIALFQKTNAPNNMQQTSKNKKLKAKLKRKKK